MTNGLKINSQREKERKREIEEEQFTVFPKKAVLKKFIKFTVKYLWRTFFFNKVVSSQPATLERGSPAKMFL